MLIESSRAYGRGLLRGIVKYSHLHEQWAFYSEPGGEERSLPRMKNWHVNGIIARVSDNKKDKEIIAMGLPFIAVAFKNQVPGVPNIIADNVTIGRMAAEHLVNCGFQQFAFCGFASLDWSVERRESFSKKLAEAGFQPQIWDRPRHKLTRLWEQEQTIMADWLKSLPKPIGLMTCNDDRSRHVIEACKIAGLHVPEEVAIIGVDNDDLICNLSDPPLSSIALNSEKAGYEAAELLHKLMAGEKKPKENINIIMYPTHVVTRQSTNILAMKDHDVVKALRFIRQHSKEPIQVRDVVEAVAISRTNLYERFRRSIGHSPNKEIRRARVEHIVQMLMNTNLSVSEIAFTLGYSSASHIARYFRQEKGISLKDYRKLYGKK